MSEWTWQIPFGLFWGSVVFAALLVSALVLQYRAFGRISVLRLLGSAAVSVYAVGLFAYTMLPLPDPGVCAGSTGPRVNTMPLAFVADALGEVGTQGLRGALTSWAVMETMLNVALFVPLGIAVRTMLGRGAAAATALGFGVSLLIEATQFTGIWGLYDCGFRVADVDDLIANTSGALLGALIAPVLFGWMPQARELAARPPRPVSALRRLLGMIADLLLAHAAMLVPALLLGLSAVLLTPVGHEWPAPGPGAQLAGQLLAAAVVFYVPALIGSGASLGQRLVGIAPSWAEGQAGSGRRLLRATVMGGVYTVGSIPGDLLSHLGVPLLPVLLSAGGLAVLAAGAVIAVFFDRRGLSGIVSGAQMVDRRLLPGAASRTVPVDFLRG